MKTHILAAMVAMACAAPATAEQTRAFPWCSKPIATHSRHKAGLRSRPSRATTKLRRTTASGLKGTPTLAESYENSPGYAVGLAQRRAGNVRSVLVEEGVPPGAIATATFGASRPRQNVPAASARNRRVEIFMAAGPGW